MTNAAWTFSGLVFVGIVALVALSVLLHAPKKRKSTDELEVAYSALRLRLGDIEDKFEHHLKRDAVRLGREKKDDGQLALQNLAVPGGDRQARLSALRARIASQKGVA